MRRFAVKDREDGRLTVKGQILPGDRAQIAFTDNGTGIQPHNLERIFDPFFTTKQTGAGLGLPLCEQYIRENSGVMEIESVKNEYTLISLIFERSQPCFHES